MEDRKAKHLKICLNENIDLQDLDLTGFSSYRFEHDALPELAIEDVDLSVEILGKRLAAPLIIGAMTGGTEEAIRINRNLSLAAEVKQVGFALGSGRSLIENPNLIPSYGVRKWASKIPLLFSNLGAVQLNYGMGIAEIKILLEKTECDALYFHLNPLQELIQPEGNRNFRSLLARLSEVIPHVPVPVLIKEVGAGISAKTARKLAELPLAGVETAGLGGTSWSKIEALRTSNSIQRRLGETFADWGIPTADSIQYCRQHMPDRLVIASGGIRSGIDGAKALALGANAVAMALPFLKAAEKSVDDVIMLIESFCEELRTVLFLTGCRKISELSL